MIFLKSTPQGLENMTVCFTEEFSGSAEADITRGLLPEFRNGQVIDQRDWGDIIFRVMLEIKNRMEPGPDKPAYGGVTIQWALPEGGSRNEAD